MSQILTDPATSTLLGYLVNMTAGNDLKLMLVNFKIQETGPPLPLYELDNNRLEYQQQDNSATIERYSRVLFLKTKKDIFYRKLSKPSGIIIEETNCVKNLFIIHPR